MKTLTQLLLILVLGTSYGQKQPNIVLFMVDDMGWQDCSVPFWEKPTEWNKRYRTPNMEAMAAQGMKFTNAYATPVCSPTRISLMTGINAARHQVTTWTLYKGKSPDVKDSILEPPAWNMNGMSPLPGIEQTVVATPLPALLKQAGYYTIHAGKAHFAAMGTPAADPKNIGFDVNIAGHAAGGPGSYLGEANYGNKPGEHSLPWGIPGLEAYHGSDVFLTEATTREALKALDAPVQTGKPFFLYLAHYAIHMPLMADKRFYQKYIDAGLPEQEARYASMIEGMDKSLGDVMAYLAAHGLTENTIILFMSDNGGFSLPPRAGERFTHNTPLRGGKGSVYEGGIRVPMLVQWPGMAKAGSVCKTPVMIEDFYPTILDMAGIVQPAVTQVVDGISFVPVIKGKKMNNTDRPFVWHFPHNWLGDDGPGVDFKSAMRLGHWKIVYHMESAKSELFDLRRDISEKTDLAVAKPKKMAHMKAVLTKSLKGYDAKMPIVLATGLPVAWPDEK